MAIPRSFITTLRFSALALAASAAFAGGGWMRGVGAVHGGAFRSAPRSSVLGAGLRAGGGTLRVLPRGYAAFPYRGRSWYFGGGHWYRPWGGGYAPFYPPIGLCIPFLPMGCTTFYFSNVPYYYYDDVYYTQDPSGGYLVTNPPPGREATQRPASPDPSLDALLIIPQAGQSEEKMLADRAKAQEYARDETDYDPAASDPSDPGTPRARKAYLRALKSYLEDLGYSVK